VSTERVNSGFTYMSINRLDQNVKTPVQSLFKITVISQVWDNDRGYRYFFECYYFNRLSVKRNSLNLHPKSKITPFL
jgi:hypothetical protein